MGFNSGFKGLMHLIPGDHEVVCRDATALHFLFGKGLPSYFEDSKRQFSRILFPVIIINFASIKQVGFL